MSRPILWASVPTAVDFVGHLGESSVVYYITDDYSLWPGGDAERIRSADRRLRRAADVLFPCNGALAGGQGGVAVGVLVADLGVALVGQDIDHSFEALGPVLPYQVA